MSGMTIPPAPCLTVNRGPSKDKQVHRPLCLCPASSRRTGLLPPDTSCYHKRAKYLSPCCMTSCLTVHMLFDDFLATTYSSRLAASSTKDQLGVSVTGPWTGAIK